MFTGVLLIVVATSSLLVGAGHVIQLSVEEEQPIRTLVGSVRENPDVADLTSSAESLRFNFRFSSGHYELFSIDNETGDIHTSRRVDREQLCPSNRRRSSSSDCSLELDVTVLPLKFYRVLKVSVNVVDVNDNSPSFPQPRISLEMRESSSVGTRLAVPIADDPDVGQFAVQHYELTQSSDVFRLTVSDTFDLWLTLARGLDRERESSYSVTITAYDAGTPSKSGSVHIQVLNTLQTSSSVCVL